MITVCPELVREWDREKNIDLSIEKITRGSGKMAWWVCPKGHSYKMRVMSRTKGEGCPVCINKQVLEGYNDLLTCRPDVASSWHPEKNGSLTPAEVVPGTKRKVWWICPKGHEWESSVADRCRSKGCPICKNRRIIKGVNDLATRYPELMQEWNYERNKILPEDYRKGSSEKVWWICKQGHEWRATIIDRSRGTGCPLCNMERKVSFPEKAILYYLQQYFENVESNVSPEWLGKQELDIYMPEYNIAIEYDGVYGHSKETVRKRDLKKNAVCEKNGIFLIRVREPGCLALDGTSFEHLMKNSSELEIAIKIVFQAIEEKIGKNTGFSIDKIDINRDSNKIYSLIDYYEKKNSLAEKFPQCAEMWHFSKNGKLKPEHVLAVSSKRVWWKGKCGHEWQSPIAYEVLSGKCPYCSGMRVLAGFNDLASKNPEIVRSWDTEKNGKLTPQMITAGSSKKVWWICDKGHSWKSSVVSRTRKDKKCGCPICGNRQVLRGYNDVASCKELLVDWDYERNITLPENVCIGAKKPVYWKCHICGYEWKKEVSDRVHGSGCKKCNQRKRAQNVQITYVKKSGSLAELHPELLKEWDWKKNMNLDPYKITSGYGKKIWWKCSACGTKWQATGIMRTRKKATGCPSCGRIKQAQARQKTILKKGVKPLSQTHEMLLQEWDFLKNIEYDPTFLTAGSGKKVWWKCSTCGYEWSAAIVDRTRGMAKCKVCREQKNK